MKIIIPEGWQYPGEINWSITNIDDLKIIVDKHGGMHFLERILK